MTRSCLGMLGIVALSLLVGLRPAFAQGCSRPFAFPIERWNQMGSGEQAAVCQDYRGREARSPSATSSPTCSRPNGVTVERWNQMGASDQWSICGASTVAEPAWASSGLALECSRPSGISIATWNSMGADAQAAACKGQYTSTDTTAAKRCGRACGELWTPEDFAESQRELDRLQREIDALSSATTRNNAGWSGSAGYRRSPRRSSVDSPVRIEQRPSFDWYRDSSGLTGSANRIGDQTYYRFSDGSRGTATTIEPFTFYRFSDGKTSVTGSSTTIGDSSFHRFSNGVTGTSTQIGEFRYDRFSNGTSCTTTKIGDTDYTTCR